VGQLIGNVRLIQGCLVGVVVGLLLAWWGPADIVTSLGFWLAGFSLGPLFPTLIAFLSTRVQTHILPSAIGFIVSMASVGGAFFPWLAGNLAQWRGFWTLMPYVIVLTVVLLVLWLALQYKPREVQIVQQSE
jgi:fucose permease